MFFDAILQFIVFIHMRLKRVIHIFCLVVGVQSAKAQLMQSFVHTGELGIYTGSSHYFGDLNPSGKINRPKLLAGVFYRKQMNDYVSIRVTGEYTMLGYSDVYSQDPSLRRRNLSFNSTVWELAIAGDFNFFRFQPNFQGFHYTPYVGVGVGIFRYNPFAYLNGEKYFLRPLGTEGQASSAYPDLQPYSVMALSIPFTFGFKYALQPNVNLFAELTYHFTNTDYLDDVSGLYAPDAFPPLPNGNASKWFFASGQEL